MTKKISIILMALAIIFGLGACDHHSKDNNKPESHVHTLEVIPAIKETCTTTGLTEGKKCSECGEILVAQNEIHARGHNYIEGICSICSIKDPEYKIEIDYQEIYSIEKSIELVKEIDLEQTKKILIPIINNYFNELYGKMVFSFINDGNSGKITIDYNFDNEQKNDYKILVQGDYATYFVYNNYLYKDIIGEGKYKVSLEKFNSLDFVEYRKKIFDIIDLSMFDYILENIVLSFENDKNSYNINKVGYDKYNNLVIELDGEGEQIRIIINGKEQIAYIDNIYQGKYMRFSLTIDYVKPEIEIPSINGFIEE